jgi:phage major head subunit gpT-like protein
MTPAMEQLQSTTAISSVNEADRTLSCRFYSGAPIQRSTWDGQVYNVIFEPGGADLSRLQSGAAPVLDSHFQSPITKQLGVILSAQQIGGEFFATVKISERPDVEPIWTDLKTGVIRGISMGVEILEYRDESENGKLQRRVVTKWRVLEISLVSIPADAGAVTLSHQQKGPSNMPTTNTDSAAHVETMEHERTNFIRTAGAKMKIDAAVIEEMCSNGTTAAEASTRILNLAADRSEAQPQTLNILPGADSRDKLRDCLGAAMYCRLAGTAPSEEARPFAGLTMAGMAREYFTASGALPMRTKSDVAVIELAFAGQGTSDFPNILANSAGKSLLTSYQAAESPLKRIARRAVAKDYKAMSRVRLGEFPTLERVNEHGEYHRGAIGETGETYKVADYGKITGFTRQAIINDDLSAFSDGLRLIGSAAADKEAALLVELLTANNGVGPTMSDGKALFHTGHKNLASAGSGSALALTALDAARKAMRTQTAIDGKTIIDARPKFLVVPANLETSGQQVLATIQATKTSDFNPFGGLLELTVEPRFDAISTTRWYLAADPGLVPCIEYAYLGASMGPEILTRVGFEVDGLEVKCRLTFGAGVLDYRGIYASPGA